MSKNNLSASKVQELELQLEEALQMLRLVSKNMRTCLEVKEWLIQNHPETDEGREIISSLLAVTGKRKSNDRKQ